MQNIIYGVVIRKPRFTEQEERVKEAKLIRVIK